MKNEDRKDSLNTIHKPLKNISKMSTIVEYTTVQTQNLKNINGLKFTESPLQ